MIYGSAAIGSLPHSGYVARGYAQAKLAVPVAPASFIYSQFEHVSGVPAPEGTRGVSVSKLKILDVMIDQLSELKRRPDIDRGSLSEERIDALIDQYQKEIRGARAASAALPYRAAPAAPAGVLVDLVA